MDYPSTGLLRPILIAPLRFAETTIKKSLIISGKQFSAELVRRMKNVVVWSGNSDI